MTEHPIIVALSKLQYDLTGMQARLTEIKRQVAALDLAPASEHRCEAEHCGLVFRSKYKLAEHLYVSHDGDEPEHWQATEARSAEPQEVTA